MGRDPHEGQRRPALVYLLALVVPVVFLRGCLFQTFIVRGISMEPTLHGRGDADQLVVLRQGLAGDVRRWDVVVIDSEFDKQLAEAAEATLKRVVATGNELIEIVDGDVVVMNGLDADGHRAREVARKPDALVRDLLMTVDHRRRLGGPWRWDGPPRSDARLEAPGEASYEEPIVASVLDQPSPHVVGDVALGLTLDARDGAIVTLTLREGVDVFGVRLAPVADGGATLGHNLGDGVVASAPEFAGLEGPHRVLAWNVDNGVRVFVDDELLLAYDYPANTPQQPGAAPRSDPRFGLERGAADVTSIEVMRDLHYTADGEYAIGQGALSPFRVPPGHVFVLGDNSARSRDSRQFGPVPEELLIGRAFAIFRPYDRQRLLERSDGP